MDMSSAMHDMPSAEGRRWVGRRQKVGIGLIGGRFLCVDMPSAMGDVPSAEDKFLGVDILRAISDVPSAEGRGQVGRRQIPLCGHA